MASDAGRVRLANRSAPPQTPVSGAPGLRPWTDHLANGDERDERGGAGAADSLTAEGTLVHAFLRRWREAPADPLWLDAASGHAGWTNADFEAATRHAAERLLGAGLEPGDRVLWGPSASAQALVANVACLRAGLVVVPVVPDASEPEVAAVAATVGPRGAVVDDAATPRMRRAAEGLVVVTGPEVEVHGASGAGAPIDRVRPDDPALIGLTSGTTGAPKGAPLRQRHLLAGAESLRRAWRWTPDDRLLHCLPLFHSHGLCVGAYGTMVAGASAVLLRRFDPAAVADAARRERATLFFGVPTMYHRLLGAGRADDLRGLRLCVSGSAPLPAALFEAARAAIGAPVLERYGTTETLMITSNPVEGERRPGSVGFPLPGVEMRLGPGPDAAVRVAASASPSEDDGSEGPEGAAGSGEVLVRGPSVFDGYVDRPGATDATDAAFVPDGAGGRPWFRTGDLASVVDGYLVIRGRSKELIISGGHNVHPGEVEQALAGCPGTAEVAVTGTPSEEWGEVVTAWVVPEGRPPTLDDLARFSAGSLAPYKRPRRLHLVDELPRNALGKVLRNRLPGGSAEAAGEG